MFNNLTVFFRTMHKSPDFKLCNVPQGTPLITLCVPKKYSATMHPSHLHVCINPLRPNSDLSQTSHCNIKRLSVGEVMRIENMIIQVKLFDILTASPHYFCKKWRICNLILGLKG